MATALETIPYVIYKNVTGFSTGDTPRVLDMMLNGYNPGDTMLRVYEGQASYHPDAQIWRGQDAEQTFLKSLAGQVYFEHSADDRISKDDFPSVSVGDVIEFVTEDGNFAFTCRPFSGWERVDAPAQDQTITDKTYAELSDEFNQANSRGG